MIIVKLFRIILQHDFNRLFFFFQVEKFAKREKLLELLREVGTDKTLVFVETKRNADFLASALSGEGFPTTSIHGDRLQREREEALSDFKNGILSKFH